MIFQKLSAQVYPPNQAQDAAFLSSNNWDDFGYKTLFNLIVFDSHGVKHEIGSVKIGYVGQEEGWTTNQVQESFAELPNNFFSLGQDADYYENLVNNLPDATVKHVLSALGDVAYDNSRLAIAEDTSVFKTSFLRSMNHTTIGNHFERILQGNAPLTSFNFSYKKEASECYSGIKVDFEVSPKSKPSTNIHVLIGRNGVGKTTLLNNMVKALHPDRDQIEDTGYFAMPGYAFMGDRALEPGYFAGIVSVSFSAFDPFLPPDDQPDAAMGMRYCYVGLKKRVERSSDGWSLKNQRDLCSDFIASLEVCFALSAKKKRWISAVNTLRSDTNFAEMPLERLINSDPGSSSASLDHFKQMALDLFSRMSSGHAIVLLTITKLVESVEEKTLVLIDEPESHLHPPLLSAFTRALSDLLVSRNAVAIVATHSPVVLQEVPKSCVSILRRTRLISKVDRPERETFAENVGVLTREVFGLEVSKSGFHNVLADSVVNGYSYEQIESEYDEQLGFEGKAILRAMIASRDSSAGATE